MINLGSSAVRVIETLEKTLTLEQIVKIAIEDSGFSDHLEHVIRFEAL